MKYALLIYDTPDAWSGLSDQESEAVMGEYAAIAQADGVVGGSQLQLPDTATTVRVAGHETLLSDGPFVEAKEFFGGYYIADVEDLDAATALARRIPAARMGGAIEIRPIVERPGS